MNSYYYSELPVNTFDDETALAILGIFLAIMGVVLVCCLVGWILRSMSLYSIAKRRGIRNAWLAWIPLANYWVLGSVSDQYQHLAQNKVTSRRKIMLILGAVGVVLGVVVYVAAFAQAFAGVTEENAVAASLMGTIPGFLSWGVGIASLVFYHMCNYDLYRSCRPNAATAFLVLGIIFAVCEPFFYLACRKKDWGMPQPQAEPAPALDPAPELFIEQ